MANTWIVRTGLVSDRNGDRFSPLDRNWSLLFQGFNSPPARLNHTSRMPISHSMATSSLLSLAHSSPSSLSRSLDTTGWQQHHRGLGIAIRNGGIVSARERSSVVGKSGSISCRVSDFSGLRKMSSSEGLSKRIRDPQLAANDAKSTVTKTRNYVSAQMSKPGVKSLVVAVAIPLILGSVNALFNSPFSQWFSDLKKPWWQPPGFLFGGAWSVLYPLMGLASWLVWAEGGFHKQTLPLALYVSQLFLNLLWPLFFFGWKRPGLALVDILILDGVLVATINSFQAVNHVAANLMKPYLAWVIFATALTFNLWLNNRGGTPQAAQ